MGEACKLSCSHCSYNKKVFLGFGFRYMNLISILEWYKDDEGKQRISEFMNEKDTTFDCFDGLYVCHKCHYQLNEVYLHISSESQTYTNSYICPRCTAPMPSMPLDNLQNNALDCPECGQEKLEVNFYMDWD
ncbi:hypothetical protein [Paenibacillus endoradicis]|uniref:hypothetical protein n=1 Tax=Paenibacillus endoradicis TaxID=2972487 RepID=UPI002158AE49|nr:hypothetical protein [Paenibacillus endoradicis]MCR8656679.1 hypothetical protein [Paenibacillus endoradicis]